MNLSHEVIYGDLLEYNRPLGDSQTSIIHVNGQFNNEKASFGITEEMLSKHILLVGGTGSGKTNLFYHMVKQLQEKLNKNDVMLIFDSKGDFFNKFYKSGDIIIGNSSQYRQKSEIWNICKEISIDGKDETVIFQNTYEICKSLFAKQIEKNSSNPFFPIAASELLASIIIALSRDDPNLYNEDLKTFIDSSSADDIRSLLGKHKELASVAAYIGKSAGSQAQGVLSEMYTVTREILTGVFADAGDFSIREFIRNKNGKTAFIEYDLSIGDVLSPVYTILFDLALKEALGRTATQGNVYLICDELKLLPNLRHLEDGINFGRSLGVKILAGLQSIDQLNANYDNETKAKNAVSGFSSVFAFLQNDFSTRKYISELMGQNLVMETFNEANGTMHYDKREGHVVEDWDLVSLKIGEAIVKLPAAKPFKFKFDLFRG